MYKWHTYVTFFPCHFNLVIEYFTYNLAKLCCEPNCDTSMLTN